MIYYFSFLIIVIVCLYLSWLVYLKSPKNWENRLFFYTVLTFVIWSIFNYYENEEKLRHISWLFLKLDFAIAPFVVSLWVLFCISLAGQLQLVRKKLAFAAAVPLIFSILSFSQLIIKDINFFGSGIHFSTGALFLPYAFYILFCIVCGTVLLTIKYKNSKGRGKILIMYIMVGFYSTFLIIGFINLFLQRFLPVKIYRLQIFSILFFIGFTSYAIIRHHLFDIRSFITRGIIYSGVLGIFIGFYMLLVSVIGYIFQRTTDATVLYAAIVTSLIGIMSVQKLKNIFSRLTDKIFYKDKYDYSRAVFEISEILNKNISLAILLRELFKELKSLFKTKTLMIVLPDKKLIFDVNGIMRGMGEQIPEMLLEEIRKNPMPVFSSLKLHESLEKNSSSAAGFQAPQEKINYFFDKYHIELIVQIRLEDKLSGLIFLGEKLSGDIYTEEDASLLKTLSYQAAVALERAQLFERVESYSYELEKKVRQRTAKIKKLQEEQNKMMLEIAHGLQTPLTIVKSEISTLPDDVKAGKEIKALQKNIDRISQFIYDMLRLARLGNEKEKQIREEVNFSAMLSELIESFEIIAQDKEIKLFSEIHPDIFVSGNKHELEELVTNLVSNSVKYTAHSLKREISLALRADDGTNNAVFTVIDTGRGISSDDLPNLFNRFYRGGKNGSEIKGTGLGLAICKNIVSRHHGTISADSKVGIWTKFTVILPLLPKPSSSKL